MFDTSRLVDHANGLKFQARARELERAKQRGKHLLEPSKGELRIGLHACGARQLTP